MTISTFPSDRNNSLSSMRYEPRFQIEAKSDDFDLTSGWRLIRRRIVLIGVLTTLFMVPAITMISGLQPIYHAESRLIIHRPLATTLNAEDSGRNGPLDLSSEMERLLSRSAAERVIRELRLEERPEFNPALRKVSLFGKVRETLRSLVTSEKPSLSIRNSVDAIIPEYYRALRVWRDGQGDVIQIGFAASDPQLAAAAPNRLIGIYLEERKDSIRDRLDAAEEWLRQRIGEQQDRVKQARDATDKYQESVSLVANEDAQSEQIKSIMVLSDRQTKIEQSRAEIMATISTLETAADVSLALQNIPTIPDGLGTMERDLRTQQQDLDRLLETYGNNSEAVVDLRAKILKSRTDLGLAVDRYVQSMRARLAALDREDGTIRSAFAAAEEQRSRSALAQTDLARLQRIVDREQTALDAFEGQRRSLAAQATLPGAEVEVLSPAAVPLGPQGRGRLFYMVGALLASVSIGVMAAFVVEMLDRSVRSFDQLAGMARIVPAGLIPRLPKSGRRNRSMLFGHVQSGMFDEAIRTVIISLEQSNGGKMPGSIVVTSSHSGEGKSFVARSLAIELAAAGNPVLLVDGDLRHGNLDTFFKSGLKQGLNEILTGQVEIRDVIHNHHPSGVDFIPAGNPGLHGRVDLTDVAKIIDKAHASDQIVIFDSAPVLASTDTMHLTALAERTLVVVRWAKTSRRAVEFSIQHLKNTRNADIAIAINNVEPKRHALYHFSDSELFVKSLMKYHNFVPKV
jgi:uncharacterized protein involved in exopolysaccharide biosynthesis/Mrp family chromosome partitioning ATPase